MFQVVPCKGFETVEWETMRLGAPPDFTEVDGDERGAEGFVEEESAEPQLDGGDALGLSADGRRRRNEGGDEDPDFSFDELDEDEDLDNEEDDYDDDYDDDDYDDDYDDEEDDEEDEEE
jgi:hypothetical protein